jgi:hypothetical protein
VSSPADLYANLRTQVLTLDPAAAGIVAAGPVWGFVMDMGMDGAVATLVALADGTTSLYTTSGFGIIGGGGHADVVAANRHLIETVTEHLPDMTRSDDFALPAAGTIHLHALTSHGDFQHRAAEDDLGYGRDPLSDIFHAGHEVITRLRLIEETRG